MAVNRSNPELIEAHEEFMRRTDSVARSVLADAEAMEDIERSLRQRALGQPFRSLEELEAERAHRAHRKG